MVDRLLVVGFWLAFAFSTYSAFAPPDLVAAPKVGDIALHLAAFFVLTVSLQMAHLRQRPWLAALWMFAYGAAIELIQLLLADRSAELKDLLVDAVGIALGLVAYRLGGTTALRLLGVSR